MDYQHITLISPTEHVCVIGLSRPESANALNQRMAEELVHAWTKKTEDKSVRVIILTGRGEKAFCAGADLKERRGMTEEQWHKQHEVFEQLLKKIMECPKPVIAAVNGAAIGGGLELALACDFIYAARRATLGLTEVKLGIMPGLGGTQNLPRAIGSRAAKELLYTGQLISAEKAVELGLANRMLPYKHLMEEVIATATIIAGNAPLSLKHIKRSVDQGMGENLEQALHTELRYYNGLLNTKDRHEGINAFNEKRKAQFTGT